ncbi:hypothetical protein BDA96_01G315400 [Sorghum bicolor]|uniref:Uncharacterized protein n=2 Tax=Sorghum bicolor TaxID=4558 RepID=A0A921S456_SORBI|nr:hypothetical protein SORBI_3001G291701 [Sorghum bicolor]KAG0550162.1 hypothetical protein BDA96_01G315400 [Sorghum bicolor]
MKLHSFLFSITPPFTGDGTQPRRVGHGHHAATGGAPDSPRSDSAAPDATPACRRLPSASALACSPIQLQGPMVGAYSVCLSVDI